MNFFHKEFYPTPPHVIEMMGIYCEDKIVLEPHAGKGDIVDYCKQRGAKDVICFEINEDLQKIVAQKGHLIGGDFFDCKPEDISHVNLIVMNPPFSNADKHIQHAWKIAPDGCEIISLCNYETINKDYLHRNLKYLIDDYGMSENLGTCFDTAERTTGIEIGLIRLFKPISNDNYEFEGFFVEEDPEELQANGIMPYNEIRALVNRYVGIMKNFDTLKEQVDSMNYSLKQIDMSTIDLQVGYKESITTKEQFSKLIQKRSWEHIFRKMNMDKYVTSGVMKDINKFVEMQTKYPFTMKNIYRMLEIIVGTREETYKRALVEAIDNFTQYTDENRFGVEGWKTNSGYMLNKKFIVDGIMETASYMGFRPRYDSYGERKLNDLIKVLCNLTGTNYDTIGSLYHWGRERTLEPNTWYDWGFFEVKFFKKGTMHIKFKNVDDWYILNAAYGKIKGFSLPETYKKKK